MKPEASHFRIVAELASAIAVVVSLVFVGLEVRETARQTELNTEAMRLAAYQDLISQISQFNVVLLDSATAAVHLKIEDRQGDAASLTPIERSQADRILFLLVRHADMAFYQYEKGLLSEDRLESAVRPFTSDLDAPLYREFWGRAKGNFVPSFQAYIDSYLGQP